MNRLLDIQDKLRTTGAALGRLETEFIKRPASAGLLANIRSLKKLESNLIEEFQSAANTAGRDVCRYKLLDDNPTARALAKAIGTFQEAFSLTYDALRNGPKTRRVLTPRALEVTELRIAYTFPGSFGVVFTLPNDVLLGDMPTPIDDAMNTVFDVARSQTSADIRSIAHHVGRAPIAAMYDWAKGNAQNRVGANIEWLRGQTVRAEVLVQSPDFEAISQSIEKTSESSEKESAVPGILVGADTKTRRFHFISDDDESFRGRFMDAISESQTVEIPARYVALIQTTTLTNYSTETEQVSHFLARLAPRP